MKNIAISAVFALCSIPAAFSCPAPQPDASTLFTMITDPKTQAADVRSFLQSHAVGWDAVNEKCETTLLTAISQNRNDLFQILFEQYKPNLNQKQPGGNDSIYSYTLRMGTVETLKTVQSLGQPFNLSEVEDKGVTELMVASMSNSHVEMIQYLLSNGNSIGAKDGTKQTAIFYAAKTNPHVEVVQALINARSNLNQKDKAGNYPLLDAAQSNPNPEVINTLIQAGAVVNQGLATNMLAAEASRPDANIDVMKNLIQRGATINADNGTIFLSAVQNCTNVDVVTMLIQAGASVNVATADGWGNTPLIEAVKKPILSQLSVDLVTKLIQAGATVNATNREGQSALAVIVHANNYKNNTAIPIIRVLMDAGAASNMAAGDRNGLTILQYAENYGAPQDVINLLSGQTKQQNSAN